MVRTRLLYGPPLFLQLLLQLVEEAPVGALGDDRLGGRARSSRPRGDAGRRGGWYPPGCTRAIGHRGPPAWSTSKRIGCLEALVHEELGGSVRLKGARTWPP